MTWRSLLFAVATCACTTPLDLDETRSAALANATTVVALTFDDGLADQFQVGELVSARGLRATFYVNSGRIGQSGYMTHAQLAALEAQGHEIGGHTITHANLTTLSDAEARVQVCNDRVALLDAGYAVTSFAHPFGADTPATDQIARDCGYNSGRDVGGLVTPGGCDGCPYANALPPAELYALRTSDSVKTTTTLATMQEYVTQAEQNGGGFVPILFHHVCNGCDTNSVTATTLAAFLDWLAARPSTTQVATVDEVIGGAIQPPVPAPTPIPAPTPAGNMLRNPSLETDADGNQVPDCWQRGGFGTSTATYALVSDAFEGNVAQRITISSFTSGGRRLLSAQDLGTCAPAVTPGHRYTVSAFYKATTQPLFSIYYRTTNGAWIWLAQSALLPTSASYRQATYTTPAMPADATAISVALTIVNVGTITMDGFKLYDAADPPPNLLNNPSLETDTDGNQIPDCWKRDGNGTNTATYTLVSDAADGTRAQRIDITSWSSGSRRLASATDTGACAPAVIPGNRYTVGVRYKATVQPRFTIAYRTTAGTWKSLAESPALSISASTYRQTTYTTPPMPADAAAISVGVSIYSVGSLTTDSYTLVDTI
jgi:peptidoglycan/xylan/chitin deacetylase (PgdA/CDA1 family)